MTELFSQFTDNLSGLAFDAIIEPDITKAREAKEALAEIKPPDTGELGTVIAVTMVVLMRQELVHQLQRECLAEVLAMPVPGSTEEVGIVIAIGCALQAAIVFEMNGNGRLPEAKFARYLAIAAFYDITTEVGIDEEKGTTPLVRGEILNGRCHSCSVGEVLAVDVVTQVVMQLDVELSEGIGHCESRCQKKKTSFHYF